MKRHLCDVASTLFIGSAIALDPKGELYDQTAYKFEKSSALLFIARDEQ